MSAQVISLEERRRARELERAGAELERVSSHQVSPINAPAAFALLGVGLFVAAFLRGLRGRA